MKWTEIDWVKAHSRIDYDCEDSLLELYAESAEAVVLNLLNRRYEELVDEYGDIPAPIRQATLMLVDHSYKERAAASVQQLHAVPYTIDVLLKPYMRL
jgi:uncharacterized phage protein (predicted DNA packaging)